MYEGASVELVMEKMILRGADTNETPCQCRVLNYDKGAELMYLLLLTGKLCDISLDAIYKCDIVFEDSALSCDGMVKERYQSEEGEVLIFRVENGFYKINIK